MSALPNILSDIQACQHCAAHLPLGPRPVVVADTRAKIVIIGQAPGTRVHKTGIPWNDPSGDRLRQWLQMDRSQFYSDPRLAIIPMGFCYPGKGKSGDLPPRPECAPKWHDLLLKHLPHVELVLLIGQYAQRYYLPSTLQKAHPTLTARVKNHDGSGRFFPLPHPSPRNQIWLKKNPWFNDDTLPMLRERLAACLETA